MAELGGVLILFLDVLFRDEIELFGEMFVDNVVCYVVVSKFWCKI